VKDALLALLSKELTLLDDSTEILKYSYGNCQKIGIQEEYVIEDMDQFEAFTSRFARMSDMLIQKIFRLIDKIELDDEGTIRDRINRAEKKGIIGSADTFIQIRIVRNDIAHEYHTENLKDIYKKVLELAPYLLNCVEKIREYCKKRNYIS
jgi:uncharacterized protein YutE (UPF0331/DUF86 family)